MSRGNGGLMIFPAARAVGVALFFAAGLLAVLLVAGVVWPSGVGAHDCAEDADPADMHEDFHGIACTESGHDAPHENIIEVDGGRDREVVFRVYPPLANGYLDMDDKIEITLPGFDLLGGVSEIDFSTVTTNEMNEMTGDAFGRVIISDSGDVEAKHPRE